MNRAYYSDSIAAFLDKDPDEILGQLAPGLSASEWKEQGEQLFLSLAAGEQQASVELIRPSINRRSVGTVLVEYADDMKWLAAQQPFQHRRKTRRGKRGGRKH